MALIIMVFSMTFLETKLLNKIDKSSKTSSLTVLHNNFICIAIKLSFARRIRKSMTGLVVFLLIECRILEGSLIDFNTIHSNVHIKIQRRKYFNATRILYKNLNLGVPAVVMALDVVIHTQCSKSYIIHYRIRLSHVM